MNASSVKIVQDREISTKQAGQVEDFSLLTNISVSEEVDLEYTGLVVGKLFFTHVLYHRVPNAISDHGVKLCQADSGFPEWLLLPLGTQSGLLKCIDGVQYHRYGSINPLRTEKVFQIYVHDDWRLAQGRTPEVVDR